MPELLILPTSRDRVRKLAERTNATDAPDADVDGIMIEATTYVKAKTNTWKIFSEDDRASTFRLAADLYAAGLVLLQLRNKPQEAAFRMQQSESLCKSINQGSGPSAEGDVTSINPVTANKGWYSNNNALEPYVDTYEQ